MPYKILNFDAETTDMTFLVNDKENIVINLDKYNLTKYEGVNPTLHYLNTSNNEIVIIESTRLCIIDNQVLYKRASQFEYDRWLYNIDKNSDNAKLFKLLEKL